MARIGATIGAILAAIILTGAAPPPVDPATVTIETVKLTPGVAALFGKGGNVGVSYGSDGTVFIDDQFAPLTPKLIAAAKALDDRPVRFVINTHWHFDHSGGNENLGKAGAVIVAHDNVRTRMSTDQFMKAIDYTFPASPKAALPVITFADTVTFHLNGDTLRAIHMPPAHTDGDVMVKWEKANVLHTGDIFNRETSPFADTSSGGSFVGMIAAMDAAILLTDDKTIVIPGHGPISTRADMIAYRAALKAFLARVIKERKSGKTLEQIMEMKLMWPAASGPVPADFALRAAYEDADK